MSNYTLTTNFGNLSLEELTKEAERLANSIYLKDKEINKMHLEKSDEITELEAINRILEERENTILAKTELTENHKKLLKRIPFEKFKNGEDLVFIGFEEKRFFGISNVYEDVAEILGWELLNGKLSDEQVKQAKKILKELPFVINNILTNL